MLKPTILFWNIQKRSIPTRVASIIKHYEIDIVVLAECRLDRSEFCKEVKQRSGKQFFEVGYVLPEDQKDPKLRIFSHLRGPSLRPTHVSLHGDVVAASLMTNGGQVLVVGVHLPAPFKGTKELSSQYVTRVASAIGQIEDGAGHRNTIVVGDFNMNPYDAGMTGKLALSAVLTRDQLRDRKYMSEEGVRSFYNPMWGLFGDRTAGPPGTFKLELTGDANCWHMLDQVLVRESLALAIEDLKILDSDGTKTLLTKSGYPDPEYGSDHLPLLFQLDSTRIAQNG